MQYPFTAGITLSQLNEDSDMTAALCYGAFGEVKAEFTVKLSASSLSDATDIHMLMQIATALLCDKL